MKKIEQFYITELTLAGFKNYLEPATFVFGNPTVITGGNGQGKSTLADAVAFAVTGLPFFGERGIDRLYNDAMKQQMELSVRLRFVDQDGAAHELYRLRNFSVNTQMHSQRRICHSLYIMTKDPVFIHSKSRRKRLGTMLPGMSIDIISTFREYAATGFDVNERSSIFHFYRFYR